jgi:hypothetical protein
LRFLLEMAIHHALVLAASYPRPETFDRFREHIRPEWIEEALEATGTATLRRRRLPVEQVIWLVLGIALFRNSGIDEVVDKLDLALASPRGAVAKSAIPPARARLGEAPMKWLFERTARKWAYESADRERWRGLSLFGIDGSSLRLADTESNRAAFGGWKSGEGDSSNPLLRLVVLMALRSHLLVAASFGPYATSSELQHAKALTERIPMQSLTILDGLFLSAAYLLSIENQTEQRHWMTRAKATTRMRVLERHSATDCLVEMDVSDEARKLDPSLPTTWRARAITHHYRGKRTLLTSMLDPKKFPEREVRALYHERWELELAYDELKTEMLEAEVTLRSKSPVAVRQELWGVLIGFNLVRLEMERIAAEARVEPTRISFVAALHLIRDQWDWNAIARSPGAIPKHLTNLRMRLKRFILPPRRASRSYPRVIKNDYRRYPRRRTNGAK